MTYSLVGHDGDHNRAGVVEKGELLNQPDVYKRQTFSCEERAWVSGAAAVLSGEAVAAPPRQNRHNISVITVSYTHLSWYA